MALIVGTNSYDSRENADAYFNDSMRKDVWKSFSGGERDRAMIESTRVLERQPWQGIKEDDNQNLHFPATGLYDRNGKSISAAKSLTSVSEAQYEYALFLLEDVDELNNKDATGNEIKSIKAGSADIEYFRHSNGSRFPVIVMDLIGSYLSTGQSFSIMTPYASGICDESSFQDSDKYDVIRGF
jgi:hypothetical protein